VLVLVDVLVELLVLVDVLVLVLVDDDVLPPPLPAVPPWPPVEVVVPLPPQAARSAGTEIQASRFMRRI
jgi:hypothetical protein